MTSLPPVLLNQLLNEISTLASVYHKPPETFVGHGRSEAIQIAAIQEQRQNAAENPIAASVSAAANGTAAGSNTENLLDIDFDGAAPASAEAPPVGNSSGLEGLAGTPQRVASPAVPQARSGGLNDMMGLFDAPAAPAAQPVAAQGTMDDLMGMNGFAGLDLGGSSQPPPPQTQMGQQGGGKKPASDDLLGMFD